MLPSKKKRDKTEIGSKQKIDNKLTTKRICVVYTYTMRRIVVSSLFLSTATNTKYVNDLTIAKLQALVRIHSDVASNHDGKSTTARTVRLVHRTAPPVTVRAAAEAPGDAPQA
jgi:hypothetical protein